MSNNKELDAKILRYHFVEHWGVNTIADQLGIHHTTVDRVLCQAGMPKAERTRKASIVDPYHPMIIETLEQYPRLSAAKNGATPAGRASSAPTSPGYARASPPRRTCVFGPCPANRVKSIGLTSGTCK